MAADGADEDLRHRLVIALRRIVHPADALIVTANETWKIALGRDLRPLKDQPGAGRKVGLVGPLALGQGAGEKAFARAADRIVVRPEPRFVFAHFISP
jgi:hypothetical protein